MACSDVPQPLLDGKWRIFSATYFCFNHIFPSLWAHRTHRLKSLKAWDRVNAPCFKLCVVTAAQVSQHSTLPKPRVPHHLDAALQLRLHPSWIWGPEWWTSRSIPKIEDAWSWDAFPLWRRCVGRCIWTCLQLRFTWWALVCIFAFLCSVYMGY